MTEPTQEQIKEFWEWCGFTYRHAEIVDASACKIFITSSYFNGIETQIPDANLNNLFEYAIPQIAKEYHNWKSILHDWVESLTGDYEKDVLLLFAQLYDIIKEK